MKRYILKRGDFGYSLKYVGQSVNGIIAQTFPVSAQLGLQAYLLSFPIGIFFGIIAARRRGRPLDYALVGFSVLGVSVPVFILASLLQYVFATELGWFPVAQWKGFAYTILPTLTLAIGSIAGKTRNMRTLMLEVISYFVQSIQSLDYTMTLGLTVFFGVFVVSANFVIDLIYGLVDPRIRVAK